VSALDGTVALVTGASSGIGEATAEVLATEGASVALLARRADRLEELASRLHGGNTLVLEADVTSEEAARTAVERTVSELGRLDILINNAGVMLLGPVLEAPLEEWQRMLDVNLAGFLYCARAALPHLVKAAEDGPRGMADLVNISSVAGRIARANNAVYNMTKWGVVAFSEALRQEVADKHVRVSAIEPGATDTELQGHNRPEIAETIRQRFAGIERLQAADIADVIRFVVTRPRHVLVNEIMIRPAEQTD
jgi:NADP-dependent 3-hydroxy acid dehydrogenase YdfG